MTTHMTGSKVIIVLFTMHHHQHHDYITTLLCNTYYSFTTTTTIKNDHKIMTSASCSENEKSGVMQVSKPKFVLWIPAKTAYVYMHDALLSPGEK